MQNLREVHKTMYDKRLIGTWQSDARKTRREIRNRTDLPEKLAKWLLPMFGKLRLRYTRTEVYTTFEDYETVEPYTVVSQDSDSLVIKTRSYSPFESSELSHIHFEHRHRYWVELGCDGPLVKQFGVSPIREYFRRIE
jgi:hypothetical protein